MRGWWQELAGLVLPVDCAGCGAVRVLVCAGCREALSGLGADLGAPETVRRTARMGADLQTAHLLQALV
ncbi:hypothetical protein AB0B44_42680, partial [Streptomyces sp. NPDC041003]